MISYHIFYVYTATMTIMQFWMFMRNTFDSYFCEGMTQFMENVAFGKLMQTDYMTIDRS